MSYSIYLNDGDYAQLKSSILFLSKLIFNVDQAKQEEEILQRFKNEVKNSAVLELPLKEISDMQRPKTFKKTIRIDGRDVHIRTRQCGKNISYELRYRKGGLNVNASARDKNAAIIKFSEKLKEATNTKSAPKVPTTFHEFALYYFEKYRKRKVKPATLENDLYRYNNHLKPLFGSMAIKKISPAQCQELLDGLSARGLTKTVDEIYSLLNVILKMAIAHGIIERNPLAVVVKERHQSKHGKALTKAEEKTLLEKTADTRYQLLFAVALYTGLRPNEYKTARIEGDFIIAVNSKRKTQRIEYKRIPITPMLRPYLANVEELHFPRLEYMRDKFNAILPGHKLYDLRTTFYTRCQECGVADVARNVFVGHSLGALGDTYTDLSDDFLLKEGKKLDY